MSPAFYTCNPMSPALYTWINKQPVLYNMQDSVQCSVFTRLVSCSHLCLLAPDIHQKAKPPDCVCLKEKFRDRVLSFGFGGPFSPGDFSHRRTAGRDEFCWLACNFSYKLGPVGLFNTWLATTYTSGDSEFKSCYAATLDVTLSKGWQIQG